MRQGVAFISGLGLRGGSSVPLGPDVHIFMSMDTFNYWPSQEPCVPGAGFWSWALQGLCQLFLGDFQLDL